MKASIEPQDRKTPTENIPGGGREAAGHAPDVPLSHLVEPKLQDVFPNCGYSMCITLISSVTDTTQSRCNKFHIFLIFTHKYLF